jgi:hypothetical protein
MASSKPVGKTASQGWQIGVRRTLPVSEPQAWRLMLAVLEMAEHAPADGAAFPPGTTLATNDGTRIEVRSCTPGSLLRMRWQPHDWATPSTLQIRFSPGENGDHHQYPSRVAAERGPARSDARSLDGCPRRPESRPSVGGIGTREQCARRSYTGMLPEWSYPHSPHAAATSASRSGSTGTGKFRASPLSWVVRWAVRWLPSRAPPRRS